MVITEWFVILFKNHFNLASNPCDGEPNQKKEVSLFLFPHFCFFNLQLQAVTGLPYISEFWG